MSEITYLEGKIVVAGKTEKLGKKGKYYQLESKLQDGQKYATKYYVNSDLAGVIGVGDEIKFQYTESPYTNAQGKPCKSRWIVNIIPDGTDFPFGANTPPAKIGDNSKINQNGGDSAEKVVIPSNPATPYLNANLATSENRGELVRIQREYLETIKRVCDNALKALGN